MSAPATMPRRRTVTFMLAILCAAGCVGKGPGFRCAGDGQCGAGGVCEPLGWCSFADTACASGRRYGEHSGDGVGGTCVVRGETPDAAPPAADGAAPDSGAGADAGASPDAAAPD